MAKIGLQTWGTTGDVQPFLALAGALAARGHTVELSVATASDAALEAPDGVTLTRVPGAPSAAQMAELVQRTIALSSPLAQGRLMLHEGLLPHVPALLDAAQALARRSDLLVRHHFLYMAQAAARQANLPEVSVFFTPDLLPTRAHPPTGMPSLGPLQSVAWWMMARGAGSIFLPPARTLAAQLGQPVPAHLMRDVWASPTRNLIAVSPTLFPRPADWPEAHTLTGFWRSPVSHERALIPTLDAFLSAGDAPLYATYGSMTPHDPQATQALLAMLRDAARATGRRLVVQLPDPAAFPQRSDDVHLVSGSPHAEVFPRCAAILHHGGAGTTQTALASGTPSLITPHLADQHFWAAHLKRLGAATTTPPRHKLTTRHLIRAIRQTLDTPTLATRTTTLGQSLHAEDGLATAVREIEALLYG